MRLFFSPSPPALQIALDEAAFLLDLASIEGNWDDYMGRVAECYTEGGLQDVARLISFSGWTSNMDVFQIN